MIVAKNLKTTETQNSTTYTLHDDPGDPVIMTLGSVEGEKLQILGDKDSSGVATRVDSLVLEDREGNKTFVTLDKNTSLPDRVTTESGVRIIIEWSDDLSMVHVTAVSPDGKLQVTVNVPLNTIIRRDLKQSVSKRSVSRPNTRAKRQSGVEAIASIPMSVYQCNEPENDARVYGHALLNYIEETTSWTGDMMYTAVKTAEDGVYHFEIFTGIQSPVGDDIQAVCEDVVSVLSGSCSLVSVFTESLESEVCNAIELAALDLTTATPGDFDIVHSACDSGFRAFRFYCDSFEETHSEPVDTNLVCESITLTRSLLDLVDSDTIFLKPFAEFPDGESVESAGQVVRVPQGITGILPYNFTIRYNMGEPVITSLIVSPADPDPREDYVVNATYMCPTAAMNVSMNIVGTDNYTDSVDCFGVSYACTLYVPGAEELVIDIVTVQVSDLIAGYFFTRQVVVVF